MHYDVLIKSLEAWLPEPACIPAEVRAEPSSSCTEACLRSKSNASWSGAAFSEPCTRPPRPQRAPEHHVNKTEQNSVIDY